MKRYAALILILILSLPVLAFKAANPYWLNLKPKIKKHLNWAIDRSQYTYKLIGPTRDMTAFLGNRPDAKLRYSGMNLDSFSPVKSVVVTAVDDSGKRLDTIAINFNLWVYHDVYKLRNPVQKGHEIELNNVYQTRVPVRQMDLKLYFTDSPKQKVATADLKAGVALQKNMLRHERMIQPGDMIKVISGTKLVQLEFVCKAMTSGDEGDHITLNCPEMNKKTMKAMVTGPGEAKLI